MLSGYRIMWIYVMFDLPTTTKQDRKQASQFRHSLLDFGFSMAQFSVYARVSPSKERSLALIRKIERLLPAGGKVDVILITDRQYENIIHFEGRSRARQDRKAGQLSIF